MLLVSVVICTFAENLASFQTFSLQSLQKKLELRHQAVVCLLGSSGSSVYYA